MKRAYHVPNTFNAVQDYFEHITSLPIVWDGDSRDVFADGTGYVELDGSIPDAAEVALRETQPQGVA